VLKHTHAPKFEAASSYSDKDSLEIIWRNINPIFLQAEDVAFYGFADVLNRFFFRFSLAHTPRKTRTFCDPIANFAGIENDLAHWKYSRKKVYHGL